MEKQKRRYRTLDEWLIEIGTILDELSSKGVKNITVRQLYYKLVSKGYLENNYRNYNTFDIMLTKLRRLGMIPDEVFVDETRILDEYYSPQVWNPQKYYVELWIEKATLRGVLDDIARLYRLNMLTCRGYPSRTSLLKAIERFKKFGKPTVILYIGDYDPSGEDIIRYIEEFILQYYKDIRIEKIAITPLQVEQYNLPPLPAKKSDKRYRVFTEIYGDRAVEVEALSPELLLNIVRTNVLRYVKPELFARYEIEYNIYMNSRRLVSIILQPIIKKLEQIAYRIIMDMLRGQLEQIVNESINRLQKGERITIPLEEEEIKKELIKNLKEIDLSTLSSS